MKLDESIVEEAALNWFGEMGYSYRAAETCAATLSQFATLRDALPPSRRLLVSSKR
jgi:hypothetical protein